MPSMMHGTWKVLWELMVSGSNNAEKGEKGKRSKPHVVRNGEAAR